MQRIFWIGLALVLLSTAALSSSPVTQSDANNSIWQRFDSNVHLNCQPTGTPCSSSLRGYIFLADRNRSFVAYNISQGTASDLNQLLVPFWNFNPTTPRYVNGLVSDDNYHVMLVGGNTGVSATDDPELGLFHPDLNIVQDLNNPFNQLVFGGANAQPLNAIIFDGNRTTYIAGNRAELFSLDTKTLQATKISPIGGYPLGYNGIWTLSMARGNVFIGTDDGNLFEYNPRSNALTNWTSAIKSFWKTGARRVRGMAFDGNNFIYLGGTNHQFARFNLANNTGEDLNSIIQSAWANSETSSILIDNNRFVWLGGMQSRLGKFNPDTNAFSVIIPPTNPPSLDAGLAGYGITSIAFDSNRSIFAGTNGGTFAQYNIVSNTWTALSTKVPFLNNPIRRLEINQLLFKRDLTKYRVDLDSSDSVSFGVWKDFDKNLFFSQDGNFALQFFSANTLLEREGVNTQFVLVDKTPPITSSDANSGVWQRTFANVHLYCSDNASDCNKTFFRFDLNALNGENWSDWNAYDGNAIPFLSDGNWSLEFYSTDLAGNIEPAIRQSVLISNPRLNIFGAPKISFVNGLIDYNVFVQGLYGRAVSLNASDFNISYQGLSAGLPAGDSNLLRFSNLGDGNYFLRIKAPPQPGFFRFTIVHAEPASQQSPGVWVFDQNDVEIKDHVLSLSVQYFFGQYSNHQLTVPGYIPPTQLGFLQGQTTPAQSRLIDYIASYDNELIAIVSTAQGAQFSINAFPFTISLSQIVSHSAKPNELFLVFSQGNNSSIDSRYPEIRGNSFLDREVAAFGFAPPDFKTITVGLDYYASSIDLNDSLTLPLGDYAVIVQNIGSVNGKAEISIRRV